MPPRKKSSPQRGVKPGWRRIAIEIPERFDRELDQVRDAAPNRSMRTIGTAAIGLFLGLPTKVREELWDWAAVASNRTEKAVPYIPANIVARDFIDQASHRFQAHLEDVLSGLNEDASPSEVKSVVLRLVRAPVQREGYWEQEFVDTSPPDDPPEQERDRSSRTA